MGTKSAQDLTDQNDTADTRSAYRRRRWHIVSFLTGCLAMVVVWFARPAWQNSDLRNLNRELTALRSALNQPGQDLRALLVLAEDALSRAERFTAKAAETHFLAGSIYLQLAGDGIAAEIQQNSLRAREHLEQAEKLGVAEQDRGKLAFRIGKAWHLTAEPAARVIERLLATLEEFADDRAEAYGMLAQAYVHLPEPDWKRALDASRKQLSQPTDDETVLAQARLFQGEVLLRLQEPAEARKVLSRIGAGAPPAVFARARVIRAQSCQEAALWTEAAQLWEAALADHAQRPAHPGRIHYYLGECYRALGQQAKAIRAWESALNYGEEESQAASFALAEFRLAGTSPATALEWFERGLRKVTDAQSFQNTLLSLEEARRRLERGCIRYREAGDYEHAIRLARLYEKVALPGVAQELRGQAAEAWANERRRANDEKEAQSHFCEAGEAYLAVVDQARTRPDQVLWLRRSVDRFFDAREFTTALKALQRYLLIENMPESLGEAWFLIAQAYQGLQDEAAAMTAYRKCIEYPGRFAFRARYRLAKADIEQGKYDDAEDALKQNIELMRLSSDSETHEKSLFTLANLLYQRGNYLQAGLRFEEAIERFPGNDRILQARFQLGDCYRRLAIQESKNARAGERIMPDAASHHADLYRVWLTKAAGHFQRLVEELTTRPVPSTLSAVEQTVLRYADFALADCRFDLGNYEEAIRLNEVLAQRYAQQVDHLLALRNILRCYAVLNRADGAREAIRQMREVLDLVNDKALNEHPSQLTREQWKELIESAARQY